MKAVLRLAVLTTLAIQSAYGSSNPACDGSEADKFVEQINNYNTKLESYASLVSNSPTSSRVKIGKLGRRAIITAKANKYAPVKPTAKANNGQQSQHKPAVNQEPKMSPKFAPKVTIAVAHTHADAPPSNKVHFSTFVPVEQQRHDQMIKQGFQDLARQQTVLDSMSDVCIPLSHKEKVMSAFAKTFSLYLVHHKSLQDVSNLVARAAQQPQAGWLTMGNDVNSGYNGDNAKLTEASTSTTSSTPIGYVPGGFAGYPPPEYSPQYITVTVSPSTVKDPASTASDDGSGDDDDDSDGGDDGSDSDSSSTSSVPPPPPAPTAKHHGIIYDSTIGLIFGSLHLVERLFGFGGKSSSANSVLTDLMEKVEKQYRIKL